MSERQDATGWSRRRLLGAAGAAAAVAAAGFPAVLRAQPKAIKIGAIHPVTGGLAEIGQACRLGAQMAADAVNAAGGVKGMGGARLEILPGDSQSNRRSSTSTATSSPPPSSGRRRCSS